ncbi:FAD-binding domain-containing protein [Canariomyces notabilis]|uniref:FAD-binding domain-containing protein n=1 Tax=Canariomyces notabilis TaxID=2074819 RepID=A0AAN6TF21_9PEZI|nr:FAD-binding domain-containing protein [Canariomyces arenarius]
MAVLRFFRVVVFVVLALLTSGSSCESGFFVGIRSESEIFSALASRLSPNASIILPGDPRMVSNHQRWQAYSAPTYAAVVEVAVEEDVKETVRFANEHSLPFLAVNGAHGWTSTLGRMQNGLAISFTRMKGINISPNGRYAEFQPGLTSGEALRGLWAQGKQTTTGNCMCAGIMGVMLGGGHGLLQGIHGLLADQLLEARVVLADGSSVVASPESNQDLFWALRGAGHNFGIVTSLKYKIYDPIREWSQVQMTFTQDKLEQIFALSNNYVQEEDHPAELTTWITFIRRPDIDPDSAVISVLLIHAGDPTQLESCAAPFRALGPSEEQLHANVAYPELFRLNGQAESSSPCAKGMYRQALPVYLKSYSITAMRKVHDIFTDITSRYPSIASDSTVLIEGYSQQAVTSVPANSTAKPFRDYPLLLAPLLSYRDPSYSNDMIAASREVRRVLVEGSGEGRLNAYVNYASGDESLPELYGHEPWRLEKLRRLKAKYDPQGRFNFYAPIQARQSV